MLLTNTSNYHHQIETILTYTLIAIIVIKIAIRFFFAILFSKTSDPFVTKNNLKAIDYQNLTNNYFQYFNMPIPKINNTCFQTKKFNHYNVKNQVLSNLTIPPVIDNINLNGFNLDYILVHNWIYKYHLNHKIKVPIQKFLAYYAYDICSVGFYIFALTRIVLLVVVLKFNALKNNPLFQVINETHILTIISFTIFFLSLIFIVYGILVKYQWEKQYEKESLDFVKQNFNEYLTDYQTARFFSKKHHFAIYFCPRSKKNNNQIISTSMQKDKYLGPFVIIKNSRYRKKY